jgi:hypothetical protein
MYATRYRPPGDNSCSCCPNVIAERDGRTPARERVLCDGCAKGGAGGYRDVVSVGALGIRSFEAGWSR